ncbi:MAG: fibrillarin-like rRNA/tRNA 2'-O-methyltransferase [Candidatus Altiarchaeota archaeon]|nr:fibrillarin-like rRNA/tRNA 2'-O-methyltransferase [Candidatus Altiarchaeota archaeon]
MMIKLGRNFATKNLVPGKSVYGESLAKRKGGEFRSWDPKRSKVAAAMMKGMKIPLKENQMVLYLGVATGTTASHLSDLLTKGMLFGVDFAPRVLREFILLSEVRRNLVPIMADASKPQKYRWLVPNVDFMFQDVAQPNQAQILVRNAKIFLNKGGHIFVAVKSRSIDVTKKPGDVFKVFKKEIKEAGFTILDEKRLEPFEKDHLALLLKWK